MDIEGLAHLLPQAARSDREAVRAIVSAVSEERVCELADYHGVEVVDPCSDLLDMSQKMTASRRGQALMQRTCGAVLNYRNSFVPHSSWKFAGGSAQKALLVWASDAQPGAIVVDVLVRGLHMRGMSDLSIPGDGRLVRFLDLARPRSSFIQHGDTHPQPYSPTVDPTRFPFGDVAQGVLDLFTAPDVLVPELVP